MWRRERQLSHHFFVEINESPRLPFIHPFALISVLSALAKHRHRSALSGIILLTLTTCYSAHLHAIYSKANSSFSIKPAIVVWFKQAG